MNKTIENHRKAGRISTALALAGWYEDSPAREGEFTDQFAESCRDKVVIDCGAHYGYYSAIAVAAGAKRVHAFEPNVEITGDILHGAFDKYVNVILHHYALSYHEGRINLIARPESPRCLAATEEIAMNFHGPDQKWDRATVVQSFRCVPLDQVITEKVDVIKCDTEGGEGVIFHGAQRILAEDRPKIFLELHNIPKEQRDELQRLLRVFGYPADFSDFDGFLKRCVLEYDGADH